MPFVLSQLDDLAISAFDEIIDVRSPGEFADDHLPGAINLPVLDDEERARVGTIYKQESAFRARKVGAALIAKRAGANIEAYLLEKAGGYRPLVYCWRGGMRSGAFVTILKQIGWRADTLDGGYKSFRRAVVQMLYMQPEKRQHLTGPLVVLDGNTGTAKTELLHRMASQGAQVLDLEGLAGHRGSLFGALGHAQPSQKSLDTAIATQVLKFDHSRPVFVEAESSRIGKLSLPRVLWTEMRHAPRIRIEAGLEQRGAYLARAYGDIAEDRERLAGTIDRLRPYHAADRVDAWHALAEAGRMEELACELAALHYDPKYARQRARDTHPELGTIRLPCIDADALESAARDVVALAQAHSGVLR